MCVSHACRPHKNTSAPTGIPRNRAERNHIVKMVISVLLFALIRGLAPAETKAVPMQVETLVQSTSSWDGTSYEKYPAGRPQLTILKITIAPHSTMKWHSHPLPNAGYILSGTLTIERQDGMMQHFVAGQAVAETVDSDHRGITGAEPTVLIVFYPGVPGLPLSR